ncbi:MAG TPA: hypothetical protein VFP72_20290 [Kineosporiaceae bacterium]|nr:hypothetical protein [Kineosporiaceae bacterium]
MIHSSQAMRAMSHLATPWCDIGVRQQRAQSAHCLAEQSAQAIP